MGATRCNLPCVTLYTIHLAHEVEKVNTGRNDPEAENIPLGRAGKILKECIHEWENYVPFTTGPYKDYIPILI